MTPEELLAAWHAQQTAFIEFRDHRVRAMLDVLAAVHAEQGRLKVLDLGCGPGSLGTAIADRFHDAEVVGVDRDPILLRLGQQTNTHGARVQFLDLDLTDPAWVQHVGEGFNAVVSATALHWLDPDRLVALYQQLPSILTPGAVFLNADHLGYDKETNSFLRGIAEEERERFRLDTIAAGTAMTWDDWWDAARKMPGWERESQEWDVRWADKASVVGVSAQFHLAALQAAGFGSATQIFQWFDDRVIFARLLD